MVKYLPTAGGLLLAILFVLAATRQTRLDCDRAQCTYDDRAFGVADVREVRFVDRLAKSRDWAESVLVFASGHELRLGRGETGDARVTFHRLRDFFSPGGPPSLAMSWAGSPWMFLLAAGCAIAAVGLGIQAHRKPGTHRPPAQKGADRVKRKKYIVTGAGLLVAAGLVQLVMMFVANETQGTLVLECKQRCKFQGMECLPGGSARMSVDQGTYQIEIWARSGPALWIPRTLAITTGETTTVVCE